MSQHLHRKLELIHQSLLHGKLPRNLDWNDVLELVGKLGQVQPHGGDEFAFVVGTKREFFKRPHTHELGLEEVSRLRTLFKDAAADGGSREGQTGRVVVIIDHHVAHIYQDRGSGQPDETASVEPYDPYGFHRHLIHRKEAHYQGERVPEETSFYEEVAQRLVPASEIILVGHGTGKSRAVDVLARYLDAHHPEISGHVKATETADLSALTEPEIEAIAKRHLSAAT
jgi:hypothetical protein